MYNFGAWSKSCFGFVRGAHGVCKYRKLVILIRFQRRKTFETAVTCVCSGISGAVTCICSGICRAHTSVGSGKWPGGCVVWAGLTH